MKKLFPGYIRPTEDEFKHLWDNCIFSLDANVLLRLYEYTPETREDFLKVLDKIAPRTWLTHQAAWEFMRRRLDVIRRQVDKIDEIKRDLESAKAKALDTITKIRWHPFFHGETQSQISNSISRNIGNLSKKIDGILASRKPDYPDWGEWQDNDPILNKLFELFDGKVGAPYDDATHNKKLEAALKRYKDSVPPGYKDYNKPENNFGDVLIWFQLLDKSSEDKKPLIFITDDSKEDWWSKPKGHTLGPRPKLIQEFLKVTGQQYYQYQQLRFMELAKDHFDLAVRDESMAEVEEVSKKSDEIAKIEGFRAATPYTRRDIDAFIYGPTSVGISGELLPNNDWVNPKMPDWVNHMKMPALIYANNINKNHLNMEDLINEIGLANEAFENMMQSKIVNEKILNQHLERVKYIKKLLNEVPRMGKNDENEK